MMNNYDCVSVTYQYRQKLQFGLKNIQTMRIMVDSLLSIPSVWLNTIVIWEGYKLSPSSCGELRNQLKS